MVPSGSLMCALDTSKNVTECSFFLSSDGPLWQRNIKQANILLLEYINTFFGTCFINGISVQRTNWLLLLRQPLRTFHMQDIPIQGFTMDQCEGRKVAKDTKMGRFLLLFREQASLKVSSHTRDTEHPCQVVREGSQQTALRHSNSPWCCRGVLD